MDIVEAGVALTIGKALLGETMKTVSKDISKLYEVGRDNILFKASKKIEDIHDGKSSNLRVTRDVFWNGSYTDEAICAEYFGGILASSRSEDGKDDSGVFYVDLIKSLSSRHLLLHYLIYNASNKYFANNESKKDINPGQTSDLNKEKVFFSRIELGEKFNDYDLGKELHGLYSKGLISSF